MNRMNGGGKDKSLVCSNGPALVAMETVLCLCALGCVFRPHLFSGE